MEKLWRDLKLFLDRQKIRVEDSTLEPNRLHVVINVSDFLWEDETEGREYFDAYVRGQLDKLCRQEKCSWFLEDTHGPYFTVLFESRKPKKANALRPMLSSSEKNQIAEAFNRAGLDGNGRFRSATQGYVKALDVLATFGLELDEVVNSHLFKADHNSITIWIARTNPQDPFSPVSIRNSMLALSWAELMPGRFEVLAYMS